jgi:hypothetical protein
LRLFILHGTERRCTGAASTHVKDGTLIGQYMVRYADGGGEDRNHLRRRRSRLVELGQVEETMKHGGLDRNESAAKMYELDLRLFESSWTN